MIDVIANIIKAVARIDATQTPDVVLLATLKHIKVFELLLFRIGSWLDLLAVITLVVLSYCIELRKVVCS